MSRRCLTAVLTSAVMALLALPAAAPAAPVSDSIWINTAPGSGAVQLHYGDRFSVGYTSRVSQPWAFAECRPNATTLLGSPNQGTYTYGDVMWSEYRSVYPGGPVPSPFELTDPIQGLWLGGGATCKVSLVKFTSGIKNRTVLATTTFQVAA